MMNPSSRAPWQKARALSAGFGSDDVADYIFCKPANGNLLCLSGLEGRALWAAAPFASRRPKVNGSTSNWVRVFDLVGKHLIIAATRADGLETDLAAISVDDGRVLWHRTLAAHTPARLGPWNGTPCLFSTYNMQLTVIDVGSGATVAQRELPATTAPVKLERVGDWQNLAPTLIPHVGERSSAVVMTVPHEEHHQLAMIPLTGGQSSWSVPFSVNSQNELYRPLVHILPDGRHTSKLQTKRNLIVSADLGDDDASELLTISNDTLILLDAVTGEERWKTNLTAASDVWSDADERTYPRWAKIAVGPDLNDDGVRVQGTIRDNRGFVQLFVKSRLDFSGGHRCNELG